MVRELSRRADQQPCARGLPLPRHGLVATHASAAERQGQDDLERMTRLENDFLPKPTILHPWPNARFAVRHPRSEPYTRESGAYGSAGGAPQ